MEKTADMPPAEAEKSQFVKNSVLYKEFLAEREEILKHKWIESEKAGKEIGFEEAARDWIANHRAKWLQERHRQVPSQRASDQHTSRARGVV